jgi:transposase
VLSSSRAPFAPDPWQVAHHMGRLSDPHRGGAVKDFLASGAARRRRVQLEQLPGYAPDLNPDEGVWKHLKCVELKNLCCESLAELKVELRKAKERLRHKRDVILGCIRQPGFEV